MSRKRDVDCSTSGSEGGKILLNLFQHDSPVYIIECIGYVQPGKQVTRTTGVGLGELADGVHRLLAAERRANAQLDGSEKCSYLGCILLANYFTYQPTICAAYDNV